jgi:hypothetical protein
LLPDTQHYSEDATGEGTPGETLPDVAYGGADNVRVDGNLDSEQALLRFDAIVGPGVGLVERPMLTVDIVPEAAPPQTLVPTGAQWR